MGGDGKMGCCEVRSARVGEGKKGVNTRESKDWRMKGSRGWRVKGRRKGRLNVLLRCVKVR